MDSRSAAHVLSQIAAYLELAGENPYKIRAYRTAARSVLALASDDLQEVLSSGGLEGVRGLGPATIAVIRDLVQTGQSRYLEELRQATPEGLLDLVAVPGLGVEKIRALHAQLGITSLAALELAARDGRLAKMKGMGPKTADKILKSIAFMRSTGSLMLYPQAAAQANAFLESVRGHSGVVRADVAGSIRRRREVVGDVDIVAACSDNPEAVARSFGEGSDIQPAPGGDVTVSVRHADGTKLDLYCVRPSDFVPALWRATGNADHVELVRTRLSSNHFASEEALYTAAGLPWIAPELREGRGEVEAAVAGTLPQLVEARDLRGVLHCHSLYSDGKASIAEMAEGARAKGWSYIGISDHSEAAFYASGVSRENMLEQHAEIDALNAKYGDFRILKGVEADILADGRLDYDADLLDRFDYVIASIHSRFMMDSAAMTERILRAMDDPHMTILAHPTGRKLLSRDAYAIDVEAVLTKAAAVGVAIEINADPHRLDLDWRYLHRAKQLGVTMEIGPDAHSRGALDWTDLGVAMARKGWLERSDILNARSADEIVAFAKRRFR
ncbi:MAG TPA: DNA polymerase/3'-5' exonuclease PolX [Gemmatimonadaceae bacterium]|nr:DNA polymerase/3'-5' exonuclease PolX [Gemmatimonadaceae bacterium]